MTDAVKEVLLDASELRKLGQHAPSIAKIQRHEKHIREWYDGGMRIEDITNALLTIE